MKRILACMLSLAMLFALTACGSSDTPAPAPEPPAKAEALTQTEAPPAEVEIPEPEPEPEPIVIPDPVVYTGSGDDVIEIEPFDDIWVLHVTGNAKGGHFAVNGYDDAGNSVDLFVNTTDPYDGYVLDNTQSARLLEITAKGEWAVSLESIYSMPTVSFDEPASGTGDAVYQIAADEPWFFSVIANDSGRHFAVEGYNNHLQQVDLFINTTDPYAGVRVDPTQTSCIFAITAADAWDLALAPLTEATVVTAPITIDGKGNVIFYLENAGKTATISGNAESRYFGVIAHHSGGSSLLVNTTDPYEGTVMLPGGRMLVDVMSEGKWTFTAN